MAKIQAKGGMGRFVVCACLCLRGVLLEVAIKIPESRYHSRRGLSSNGRVRWYGVNAFSDAPSAESILDGCIHDFWNYRVSIGGPAITKINTRPTQNLRKLLKMLLYPLLRQRACNI